DAYAAAQESRAPNFEARVRFGDKELLRRTFRGQGASEQRVELAMAELARGAGAALRFEKEGSGTLFYQARLRYARAALPAAPLDAGLFVERTLGVLDPG